jgi:hypothetical protein
LLRTLSFRAIVLSSLSGFLLIALEYTAYYLLQFISVGGSGLQNFFFYLNFLVMLGVPILVGYVAASIAKSAPTAHGLIAAIIVSSAAIAVFDFQYSATKILIGVAYLLPEPLRAVLPHSVLGGYVNGSPFVFTIFLFGAFVGAIIFRSTTKAKNDDADVFHS